jgi:hypothetical protein
MQTFYYFHRFPFLVVGIEDNLYGHTGNVCISYSISVPSNISNHKLVQYPMQLNFKHSHFMNFMQRTHKIIIDYATGGGGFDVTGLALTGNG